VLGLYRSQPDNPTSASYYHDLHWEWTERSTLYDKWVDVPFNM